MYGLFKATRSKDQPMLELSYLSDFNISDENGKMLFEALKNVGYLIQIEDLFLQVGTSLKELKCVNSDKDTSSLYDQMKKVNRCVDQFLSSFRVYIDHTGNVLDSNSVIPGLTGDQWFKNEIKTELSRNGEFATTWCLRNYITHSAKIIDTSLTYSNGDSIPAINKTAIIGYTDEKGNSGWKWAASSWMQGAPSIINAFALFDSAFSSLCTIHEKLVKQALSCGMYDDVKALVVLADLPAQLMGVEEFYKVMFCRVTHCLRETLNKTSDIPFSGF